LAHTSPYAEPYSSMENYEREHNPNAPHSIGVFNISRPGAIFRLQNLYCGYTYVGPSKITPSHKSSWPSGNGSRVEKAEVTHMASRYRDDLQ